MGLADSILIGWLLVFAAYNYYRVTKNKKFILRFREAELLSDKECRHFMLMYTGWKGVYRWLPGRDEYPCLHEDGEFRRFWIQSSVLTLVLVIGGLLVFIFAGPVHSNYRMHFR